MSVNTRLWVNFCTDVTCLYLFALISLLMGQFYMVLGCFPYALVMPAYPIHTYIVSNWCHFALRTFCTPASAPLCLSLFKLSYVFHDLYDE